MGTQAELLDASRARRSRSLTVNGSSHTLSQAEGPAGLHSQQAGPSVQGYGGALGGSHATGRATRAAYGGLSGVQALADSGGLIQQAGGKDKSGASASAELTAGTQVTDHSASASASALAGAEAHATATKKMPGVELSAAVGAETAARLDAVAGAKVDKGGASASGSAEAQVGADAHAKASGKVGGDVAAAAEGHADAHAGAKAGVAGKASIRLDDVTVSGKAQAQAGVSAGAGGSAGMEVDGQRLFAARGRVEASAGVGGAIGGEFSFKDGKLVIGGQLGVCLGAGAGVDLGVEIDFPAIGKAIAGLFSS